jgi:hypothetical protein
MGASMSLPPFSMVPSIAWGDTRLLESDLRVLGALCSHWNSDDGYCYPSHRTLTVESGRCPSTVKNALGRLRDLGYVFWTGNASKGGARLSNTYEIVNLPGSNLASSMLDIPLVPLANPELPTPSQPMVTRPQPPLGDPGPGTPRDGYKQTNQQTKGTDHETTAQRPQKSVVLARVNAHTDTRTIEEKRALKDDPEFLKVIAEEEARKAAADA